MQHIDGSSLQKPLTLVEAYREFKTYRGVWKLGFSVLLLVAFIPMLIFVVFASSVLQDSGAIIFLIFLSGMGLYGLLDLYKEVNEAALARRFAHANGMSYRRDFYPDDYPGLPFRAGMYVSKAMRTNEPKFLEMGHMRPFNRQRRTHASYTLTYVRVKLPKALPQMVLTRKKGMSFLRNFSSGFRGEELTLEGSFGDTFTLYAPKEYAQDAYYIFTPDVMERFLSATSSFDYEIVNDELYMYSSKKVELTKPENLKHVITTVRYILQKFNRQSSRYEDDRDTLSADGKRRDIISTRYGRFGYVAIFVYLALLIVGLTLRYSAQ